MSSSGYNWAYCTMVLSHFVKIQLVTSQRGVINWCYIRMTSFHKVSLMMWPEWTVEIYCKSGEQNPQAWWQLEIKGNNGSSFCPRGTSRQPDNASHQANRGINFRFPQMLRYVTSLHKEAFFSTWENMAAGQNDVWWWKKNDIMRHWSLSIYEMHGAQLTVQC